MEGEKKFFSGTRRTDRMPNTLIKELCQVNKEVDERINESVLRWFEHIERT